MRANLTFSLKDTSEEDMVRAVEAALGGDLSVAEQIGADVEVLPDDRNFAMSEEQPK